MLAFQHSGCPAQKWCFDPSLDVPGVFFTAQLEEIFCGVFCGFFVGNLVLSFDDASRVFFLLLLFLFSSPLRPDFIEQKTVLEEVCLLFSIILCYSNFLLLLLCVGKISIFCVFRRLLKVLDTNAYFSPSFIVN
jgi:hypothetical protein